MFRTVCIKQWPEVRERIWTYPVVAVTLAVLLQQINAFFFPIVGLFLAADLAVQIAGDDVRWKTFEFIFTRAIDRKKYFTAKFLFGLIPVAAIAALYALLAVVDLREFFWSFVAEPSARFQQPLIDEAGFYVITTLALFLVYTVVFFLCSSSFKESAFSGFITIGAVGTGIYTWLTTYLVAVTCRLAGLIPEREGARWTDGVLSEPLFVLFAAILLAVPAIALFLLGRTFYSRCELPGEVYSGRGSSGGFLWVLLVLFVIVLVLAAILLSLSPSPEMSGGR